MSDPNALYDDMEKLNALYEELCWDHDDELMFSHDGSKIIIYNKTPTPTPIRANRSWKKFWAINGWAAMIGVIAAMGSYATTGQIIPGLW